MHQFFVPDEQIGQKQIIITGADVNHIGNVLRMKPGERIRVSGESSQAYFCCIEEITQERVIAVIEERDITGTEPMYRVSLYQGIPKGDKLELIIQKAVELGVSEVIPVAMKNCVVRLDERRARAKQARWQAIAESAAKQSKRSIIPIVRMPIDFRQALAEASALDVALLAYENERGLDSTRERIRLIPNNARIGVMIGPEGGFAPEEIAEAKREHVSCISLGRRILRTETAAIATLSVLVYELDR